MQDLDPSDICKKKIKSTEKNYRYHPDTDPRTDGRTDRQTDRRTDEQGESSIPPPPPKPRFGGYNDVTGVSWRFKSPGIPIVWSTALVMLTKQKHRNSALHEASIYPEDTWRNNNVIITSKQRRDVVLIIIRTLLLRHVPTALYSSQALPTLCDEKAPVTGGFSLQRASYAKSAPLWCHDVETALNSLQQIWTSDTHK